MANQYYNATGNPAPLSRASSAVPRNESLLIQQAFDKLPDPSQVAGGQSNFYTDTGMPSAILVAGLDPNITSLTDGLALVIRVANSSIGPATIVAGGFPLKQIRTFSGAQIAASDFIAQQFISVRYDAVNDWFQFDASSTSAAISAASQAAASAAAAAASAVAAQGLQITGTSATSQMIGTGSKVFTTQGGKQWPVGVPIIAVNPADDTKYMGGTVGAYSGTSLTINVTSVGGLGETYAMWNISTAGVRGAPGQTASNTQFNVIPVAALDLDLSLGNYFTKTIAGNSTFTFSNVPAQGFSFTLRLTHNSGVITFPANVRPRDGVIPTLIPGKVHLFVFVTDDTGTIWHLGVNPNYAG